MIHIETDTTTFNLRGVGLFLEGDYVLIHRAEQDDFWTPPGGRAELGESTREAAAREMREELKVEVEIGRLLWVLEYFFESRGRAFHEIAFYYQAHLAPGSNITPATPLFYSDDFGLPLIFRWVRIDELEGMQFYPSFLKTALKELPETTQHVILPEED
ncbi:MAG: NUDIX hydrolase [Chloroflexota bacterium]|nr:NUDIX hydrolase [Chloroflexota bacterium]